MVTNAPAIELRTGLELDRIALRGVRLDATLVGISLKATLEQTFVSFESQPIEAIYTFPLPETAAVCGFEIITGDHVLTAQVDEIENALQRYDNAIAEGNGAFLLEQDRPDVFSARVGSLKPGQAVKLRISYVAPLERVDRSLRARFPTTIAPRYVSSAGSYDYLQTAIDGDALNPPHVLAVPYGLEMHVNVQLGAEVQAISSPTHSIKVERSANPDDWGISFAGDVAQMDRDVVLQIDLCRDPAPQVQVARGPDGADYLAVTFVPEFDVDNLADDRPSETVFLLDCSGSMAGESTHQATMALELCLRSLSAGDAFNVCRFGSTYQLLASEPVGYSEATLKQALAFIRRGADLGGTEVHAPLNAILSARLSRGESRNVVLLTDGQVSNEPAVIELARKWRGTNRIFSFGIGSAASGYLVQNLARVTGGAAEFISGGERIEDKVLRTFSRIGSPQVTEMAVDWGGAEIQAVAEIPPLFDGDLLRVFGRAAGGLPQAVTLKCRAPSGPQTWSLPVPQSIGADDVIARQWARSMIQSLEDAAGPPASRRVKHQPSSERQLVALSKEFNILCSRTAFVAVEHRSLEDRNAGMPELRRVPVKLAHGWGDLEDGVSANSLCCMEMAPARSRGMAHIQEKAKKVGGTGFIRRSFSRMRGNAPDADSAPLPSAPTDPLFALLALQTAEGWFGDGYRKILEAECVDVGPWEDIVKAVAATIVPPLGSANMEQVRATFIVIVALHRQFADRRMSWRRPAAKARRWLATAAAPVCKRLDDFLDYPDTLPV